MKKSFCENAEKHPKLKKKFLDFSDYNVHDIPKGIYK